MGIGRQGIDQKRRKIPKMLKTFYPAKNIRSRRLMHGSRENYDKPAGIL
jgi:hypothetical protein